MIPRLSLILLITSQLLTGCGSSNTDNPSSLTTEEADAGTLQPVAAEHATTVTKEGATTETRPPKRSQSDEPGPGPMPPRFAAIHEILKAASTSSEPGNRDFNEHSQPTVALRWFSRYGSSEQVRSFAL